MLKQPYALAPHCRNGRFKSLVGIDSEKHETLCVSKTLIYRIYDLIQTLVSEIHRYMLNGLKLHK